MFDETMNAIQHLVARMFFLLNRCTLHINRL